MKERIMQFFARLRIGPYAATSQRQRQLEEMNQDLAEHRARLDYLRAQADLILREHAR
jgi:hypothetical protein